MILYMAGRGAQFVPLVLAIVLFNFVIMHAAPGDPAVIMAGHGASPEFMARIRADYALDRPIHEQLLAYLGKVAQGDLGRSILSNRPVLDTILDRVPATLVLVLSVDLVAFVLGILLGAFAAQRFGSRTDRVLVMLSVGWYSVPLFLSGIFLISALALNVSWLPTSGMRSFDAPPDGLGRLLDLLRHMALPFLTLLGARLPPLFRVARSAIIEVMNEDFITALRAAGLSERRIFLRHALRNALLPVVTVLGLWLGLSLSGALLTETVFAWPGMGRLVFEAISYRDYPLIMGSFIVIALFVVLMSLVTDIVYAWLDPRVSYR